LSSPLLESLYTKPLHFTNRMDYPDQPHHPFPSQQPSLPDLRHALLQLQMICEKTRPDVTTFLSLPPCGKMELLATWTDAAINDTSAVMSEPPNVAAAKILHNLAAFMDDVSFANCIGQRVQDEIEVMDTFVMLIFYMLIRLYRRN